MSRPDTLVIGAGIFGVTAAIELRRRGHRVTLLDPGPLPHPDASSTDISKAIRADYGADAFYSDLMDEAFAGWESWNKRWDSPLYHADGFLLLASEPMQSGFEADSFALLTGRGYPLERMLPAGLKDRFPAWNPERFPDGYFNPRAGWAESGRVVEQLVREAAALGVTLREGVGCARFLEEHARVSGARGTDGVDYRANHTLVAAGSWSPELIPELTGLMDVVGQPVLHFLPDDPTPFTPPRFSVWAGDISRSGWYGFPALPDGRVKIANHGPGKPVLPGEERTLEPGAEAMFRTFLREALPALAEAPVVGSRLCLYTDTWDGDFYIDRVPGREGLFVATGGSGHGFKFAPVLGGIIADVMDGVPNPATKRFAWRPRGRRRTESARFLGTEAKES